MDTSTQTPQPASLSQVAGAVPIDFDAVDTAAAEAKPSTPDTKEPAADPTPAPAETKVDATETPDTEGEPDADESDPDPEVSAAAKKLNEARRAKRNPQVRINQAVARQREAERKLADTERELAALRAGKTAPTGTPAAPAEGGGQGASTLPDTDPADPKPTVDKYDSYEEFVEQLGRWGARQENKVAEAKRADLARQDAERTARETSDRVAAEAVAKHATRVDAFKAQHADFDEVITNPDILVTDTMVREIVNSDHGPAMAYELGKNPAEAARIAALPPIQQIKELGKLEERMSTRASAASTPGAARTVATSKAPKPITPVGGGAAASTVPLDQEDADAYIERRNQEERAARRR